MAPILVSRYQHVKRQSTSISRDTGNMLPASQVLAENVREHLKRFPSLARPELAALLGIGDKTLGFVKAGSGNPQLSTIDTLAKKFRVPVWELLRPASKGLALDALSSEAAALAAVASPRSRELLLSLIDAARQGLLDDDDLILLNSVALHIQRKAAAIPSADPIADAFQERAARAHPPPHD